jgi:hypothetical protein
MFHNLILLFWYAALQMSVQDAKMSNESDMSKVFEDRSFVTSILNSVSLFFLQMTFRYDFTLAIFVLSLILSWV